MTDEGTDSAIRRAIGGDPEAVTWIDQQLATTGRAVLVVMGALLGRRPDLLDRADTLASSSRERQEVAIARFHLEGRLELVDALARDHLVDHPDSLIIAWVASGAGRVGDAEPDIPRGAET